MKRMAPQVGLEPTTLRLTAGCSAIELLRSVETQIVLKRNARPNCRRATLSTFISQNSGNVTPLAHRRVRAVWRVDTLNPGDFRIPPRSARGHLCKHGNP